MKILHAVESYAPEVCGMAEVVRQLSERLAAAGHEVTVATGTHPGRKESVIGGVRVVSFPIAGNAVRGMTGPVGEYREFLLRSNVDVVTLFAAQQWAADAALPLLDRIRAKKVFVPTGFSALDDPAYRAYFESMKTWLGQCDAAVFPSGRYRDIDFARGCGIRNLHVIPNGAASEEFLADNAPDLRARLGIPPHALLILHVGSHTALKGHAELFRIFQRARLPQAVLVIAGRPGRCSLTCRRRAWLFRFNPARLWDRKRVLLTDLGRAETVALFRQADMFLFPSNVECSPIVLFESMASRTPFLTTAVGNAAEIVEESQGGILLPTRALPGGKSQADLDGSARLLAELAADKPRRLEMAERGFAAWRRHFTWALIARQYEALYQELLASPPASSAQAAPANDRGDTNASHT